MIKINLYIVLVVLLVSCGISEDCFKGNSNPTTLTFPYENFTKIKVYTGVGLVLNEGPDYEVKIQTTKNIKQHIEVALEGDLLVVKDNSSCNITRDYGVTTVYVTIPDGTIKPLIQELELYSKSEQKIETLSTLHAPIVRLYSIGDDGDGSGASDFYINCESNSQLVVECNTVSNFYINGSCSEMLLNFYFGEGKFYGDNLQVQTIKLFHRGSNDMIVKPIERIEGKILSTGDVFLRNNPPEIEVQELFTGRLIYN
ncbi:MAG: hypothetical protein CMP76_05545 [Flavobacterium sp.]|uniref:GIN domain-containing protein n=1 Tax=unclassified Flavobacterium TaxID=196869 RepID=UPI000C4ECA8E|nr:MULTISPECIES: DUF2807 domain-containing protein [unclassified Flavobacterium]MBF02741.1 hypothetical protein [Flavobacterium sp.]MCO6161758.1 DUF2807 domain-containing protein [Flavobacterium sp. NRK F7]